MRDAVYAGVAGLIEPVSAATFLGEYWQKKPLAIRRERPDYFAQLLSIEQVAHLLGSAELPSGAIDVTNADSPVERSQYVAANGVVDILKVQQLFSKGATILLNDVQRWVPALAQQCRALEKEFSAPFQTNIYMTPADGKGFRPHYDTHDVFLLQISGAKEWTVCAAPLELPLPSQPFDSAIHRVGEAELSCELRAGDLLYIPRGFVHHARSLNQISLHVTLGALLYTWADVFADAVSELAQTDPAMRRALPADFAGPGFDHASAQHVFAELLERAGNAALLRLILDRLADTFVVGRRPLAPGQFEQLSHLPKLTPADEAGPRAGLIYRLRANGETLVVLCHGREITLPRSAASALRFALDTPRYVIADIAGELDDAEKLALVRRLIEEGLVMCYTHANQ